MILVALQADVTAWVAGHMDIVKAAILGVVEGLTEFLPVSSTGHLLLMGHVLGWSDQGFGKSFTILVQLGAILAVLSVYFGRLWGVARHMFTDWYAARFVIGVLIAFLPAAVIGALFGSVIKEYLFDIRVVCISLIAGGFVLLIVDRTNFKPRHLEAMNFPLPMYFAIGVLQCLAMIPGVSRSGATIVGGLVFGADRRAAAEFSFWLAMPTMVGAFAYEAFKSRNELTPDNMTLVAVGFVCSFIAGLIVVKSFLRFLQRHTFAVFAWWRILLGTFGIFALNFW